MRFTLENVKKDVFTLTLAIGYLQWLNPLKPDEL